MNDDFECESIPWFANWMDYHQKLHPDRRWVNPHDRDSGEVYQGWMEAFDRIGATENLAKQASRRLQAQKLFFNEHLARMVEAIGDLKRTIPAGPSALSAPEPGLIAASLASQGCPACNGSGWEMRRAKWHSIPRPFTVRVACFCPCGRWRKANGEDPEPDPELADLWHYLDPDESAPAPLASHDVVRGLAREVSR